METTTRTLPVQSPAFNHNGYIPVQYTCDGDNINPPLEVSEIPDETKSLALIVEDPDAPDGVFDHWLIWNLPPDKAIAEKTIEGTTGINGFGQTGYGGPCPPDDVHRYFFKFYALDTELGLAPGENKTSLLEAMRGHILASGVLIGRYDREKN